MNSGVNVNNPVVVAAFKSALLHQGIIALLIFGVLGLAWLTVRAWLPAAAQAGGQAGTGGPAGPATMAAEPAWRQLLRVGFGLLWVFDGILQAQPKMAIGLPSQVIQPTAASSPSWVQHVVNWAGTTWSYHPMQAGAAAVWIQAGIGIWLLAAVRGSWSRLAGLASVAWGLVVWVFGESFGGIFAPGLTWLFGAPGAVLIYVVAGALIALPERLWRSPQLGRAILAGLGLFLVGMAVLQAWPGRGFWQGGSHGHPGTLAGMTREMAQTPQPGFLAAWVNAFTGFDEAHGFAVNLVAVVALALIGAAFLTGRRRLVRPAVIAFAVLCLVDWVLIEDLGIFGGLGTDPNSMIAFVLLAASGYLALAPEAAPAPEAALAAEATPAAQATPAAEATPAAAPAPPAEPASPAVPVTASAPPAEPASPAMPVTTPVPAAQAASPAGPTPTPVPAPVAADWRDRLRPASLRRSAATASFRTVASVGALGLIILGVAPMAAAQASSNADPILAESIAGSSAALNLPAKGFRLTDQHGRAVSLASLHGKVVLLTFLDPVCTTDCPLIAQEFRQAGQLLGTASRKMELVAIAANPVYYQLAYTRAFDRQEYLDQVPNWLFLTGSVAQLKQVWKDYGLFAEILPAGSMVGHPDVAFVIDGAGRVRQELNTDPGPGTTATKSSFAVLLADAARQALRSS
jgi:cytochrome oxidase Cu insertion factor (SCO1/SenC/PrrC family)